MSNRFRRDYRLTIGLGANQVIIRPPFNITFSATESTLNRSLNKCELKIPGLQESTRLKLIKYELDRDTYLPVQLEIGYQGALYVAFKGSVRIGTMNREGPIFVSNLECWDGDPDYITSFTNKVVSGTDLSVDAIIEDMPNLVKGSVTALKQTLRPKVLVGSSSKLLADIAEGSEFFIKDEKVFILKTNEVASNLAPVVNASTGLKNTPEQDHIDTTFTTVLNPTLKIGHLCYIESVTNKTLNGYYRIHQIVTNGQYKGVWEQTVTCRPAGDYKVVR